MNSRPPENLDQDTPIDRLQITVAGQRVSLRHAAMRILHRSSLNFGEEFLLLQFVHMSEDKKISIHDIEHAINNWSTSRGSDSLNYLRGIVNRIAEENSRQKLLHRTPTPKPVESKEIPPEEVEGFVRWLRDRHHHGHLLRRDGRVFVELDDVEVFYKNFKETVLKETESG